MGDHDYIVNQTCIARYLRIFPVDKIHFLAGSSFTNIASSMESLLLTGGFGGAVDTLLLLLLDDGATADILSLLFSEVTALITASTEVCVKSTII